MSVAGQRAGIDYPIEPTVKALFAVSSNVCYFHYPDGRRCDTMLTHPRWKRVKGRIAHICADAARPRYDEHLGPHQRQHFDNQMLMCPDHHVHIDDLAPDDYPPSLLRKMEAKAEAHRPGRWCRRRK